ncbi:MAG: hypothetical protein FJ090_02620 [Deltaproteobacteria bacterium]|nr:hypothetical protein [Deltaproteobacteria bacterium]
MILAFLLGCPDNEGTDKAGPIDTSGLVCDRIHGTGGVVIWDDISTTPHFPDEAPDAETKMSSVAGPLGDGVSWIGMFGPQVMVSDDSGCNWDFNGSGLPVGGDWDLVAAGNTVYAFDRLSSQGGYSKDDGMSWTAFDSGGTWLSEVVADPAVAGRLRGVQARGVVTSEDGGANWVLTGPAPAEGLVGGVACASGLDTIFVVTATGGYLSKTGGQTWDDISASVVTDSFVPSRAAIHPDDADVLFMSGRDDDGAVIVRSTDGGASWDDAASTRQVDLDVGAPLWPAPGTGSSLASAFGSGGGDPYINVYEITVSNVATSHVGAYVGVTDIAFRDDGAWVCAVHAVE